MRGLDDAAINSEMLSSANNKAKILAAPCTVIVGYDLDFADWLPKLFPARALGLGCGPMSGFDNAGVDREFYSGAHIKSNFICSLGYGDPASLFPRNPRLSFEEAGRFA
jgi:3-hydroxypropanoate dehydrogenase